MDKSVAKLVRVLDAVAAHGDGGVGTTEIARELDWPKATASRVLTSLEEYALLERDAVSKVYRLGPQLLQWAASLMNPRAKQRFIRARMAEFSQRMRCCVYLCELIGQQVICTDVAYPPVSNRYYAHVGAIMPLNTSAAAQAIAMHLGPDRLQELMDRCPFERLTDRSIVTPERLKANLEAAERLGYATCYEEMEMGVSALSVPLSIDGIPASISVVGATPEIMKAEPTLIGALEELVAAIEGLSLTEASGQEP